MQQIQNGKSLPFGYVAAETSVKLLDMWKPVKVGKPVGQVDKRQ